MYILIKNVELKELHWPDSLKRSGIVYLVFWMYTLEEEKGMDGPEGCPGVRATKF